MSKLCILVADSARAKVYRCESLHSARERLQVVYDLVNFQGRRGVSELDGGRAGQHSVGGGSRGYDGDRSGHDPEDEEFASSICKLLTSECRAGEFERLVLIAPPRFLGSLRKHLGEDCARLLERAIDHDYVNYSASELVQALA